MMPMLCSTLIIIFSVLVCTCQSYQTIVNLVRLTTTEAYLLSLVYHANHLRQTQ